MASKLAATLHLVERGAMPTGHARHQVAGRSAPIKPLSIVPADSTKSPLQNSQRLITPIPSFFQYSPTASRCFQGPPPLFSYHVYPFLARNIALGNPAPLPLLFVIRRRGDGLASLHLHPIIFSVHSLNADVSVHSKYLFTTLFICSSRIRLRLSHCGDGRRDPPNLGFTEPHPSQGEGGP